jgi:hypothetical protein
MRRFLYAMVAVGLSAILMTDEALPVLANGVIHHESENQPKSQKVPKKNTKKRPRPRKAPNPTPTPVPTPMPPTLLEQGRRLYDQRFFTQALTVLRQAVSHEPKNADCWFAIAQTYEALGYFDEAQDAYRRTLSLAPNHPELSRILTYPGNGGRKPLWDPKRTARISEIPPVSAGFLILPPETAAIPVSRDAAIPKKQPTQPSTVLPKGTPTYIPVPSNTAPQGAPVYIPPSPGTAGPKLPRPAAAAFDVPFSRQPQKTETPVYVPPEPGQKVPAYTPPPPSAPVHTPPQPENAPPSPVVSGDIPVLPVSGD